MSRHQNNLYLVGFMGSGKSTVGPLLATRLKWKFVDADEQIEKQAGKTIPEIFETGGEGEFRTLESKVLAELSKEKDLVVAVGGGGLEKNNDILRDSGMMIYLEAGVQCLAGRVKHSNRPLLKGLAGEELESRIEELLDQRMDLYESADLVVDSEDKSAEQATDEIVGSLPR